MFKSSGAVVYVSTTLNMHVLVQVHGILTPGGCLFSCFIFFRKKKMIDMPEKLSQLKCQYSDLKKSQKKSKGEK